MSTENVADPASAVKQAHDYPATPASVTALLSSLSDTLIFLHNLQLEESYLTKQVEFWKQAHDASRQTHESDYGLIALNESKEKDENARLRKIIGHQRYELKRLAAKDKLISASKEEAKNARNTDLSIVAKTEIRCAACGANCHAAFDTGRVTVCQLCATIKDSILDILIYEREKTKESSK